MDTSLLIDWPAGVAINLEALGGPFMVGSTREAAILLTDCWPVDHGRAFIHALEVCADALEEEAQDEDVRRAFVEAAEEAHILMHLQ
ncbi:DUF982 domain-containing protein [Shinella zoogloeoides]|uniref:DUF982 domain-containing protein n=1 Tax=Shinella zoogloeoides TaxID=352475 RepID=UPI000E6526EF|nr:DUF982 domain-containing protein [Shinella zoogloeoides]